VIKIYKLQFSIFSSIYFSYIDKIKTILLKSPWAKGFSHPEAMLMFRILGIDTMLQ